MNIQWYPGHMAKTRRQLEEDMSAVDALIELIDARAPRSCKNPDFDALRGEKLHLPVLNRVDLADPAVTSLWKKAIPGCVAVSASAPNAAKTVVSALRPLLAERAARFAAKGQTGRAMRVMVLGIPNVGKSTLINTLLKRKAAKAEDRPGVTRSRQWFPMEQGFVLMDTPGLLWPKFEIPETGLNLAFTGAIRDEIMDIETLASHLIERLQALYPSALELRFNITGEITLETLAKRRGYLLSGGVPDVGRMALTLMDEFRSGKLGRISLEKPE